MEKWELPRGWRWRPIKELAEDTERRNPTSQPAALFQYVDIGSVDNERGIIKLDEVKKILGVSAPSRARKVIRTGDVIFATTRPYLKNVSLVPEELNEQICSTGFCVLRARPFFAIPQYLYYACRSDFFIDQLAPKQRGANYPAVTDEAVFDTAIPIPYPDDPALSLREQQRIVERVEAMLGEVRAMRRANNIILESLGFMMEAVLEEVFGKVNDKEWDLYMLGDLVDNFDNQRVPIKKADRPKRQGTYPYYGASGIIDYVDDYIFEGEHLLISEDGANLMVRKYPIAFTAEGEFWVNNHAHVVKANGMTTNKYLAFAIAATDISRLVTGAAQPKLNQAKMNQIPIWLPKQPQMQEALVSYFNNVQVEVEEMLKIGKADDQRISDLEQGILDMAFRGEV